jgi:ArsR family transcriptional regulator
MFGNLVSELAEILNALANETRLEIARRLALEKEVACERLAEELPLSRPALSHHVRVLRTSRLLRVTRKGQYLFYSLNEEYLAEIAPEILELLRKEESEWQR